MSIDNRDKHFHIDIESTGVGEHDDLLEIGILEVDPYPGGYWKPGKTFNFVQHTDKEPTSEFSRKNMMKLFEKSHAAKWVDPREVRRMILDFARTECGWSERKRIKFMGWCASFFDVPFLMDRNYLDRPDYETVAGRDVQVGDFDYSIYEMAGSIRTAKDVFGYKDNEEFYQFARSKDPLGIELPAGKEHDAIFDCYRQTKCLNGIIFLLKDAERWKSDITF